ncbi:hypothetical protein [Pedobacter sp. MC2016-24]|uniref:hypothetical protein n=1 Tax=Pedobacter sp. MC2016-24 TaxID=2780090 RepID=UPI00187E81CC|nr:hypothetical protein [Pedobacter sp. MC2016-24]MBE9600746.1 hypothetical protein [Pedobacter sp. MC2016-24]
MESYLEKAWGESIDNVRITDVITAITETLNMDDEHGAFWVGVVEHEETVLETDKDLCVVGIFTDGTEIKAKFANRKQVEGLYQLLLDLEFEQVKEILKANQNTQ